MAVYPLTPMPSTLSPAAVLDPMWRFTTDSGVELRRSQHSRQRRRYQLGYFGKTVEDLRIVQDFLYARRLGMEPFEWLGQTAIDVTVPVANTTPVILTMQHDFQTGQMVAVGTSVPNTSLNGVWTITRINSTQFSLNGSNAGGAGTCWVWVYLPHAVARFSEDTMEAATKVRGYINQLTLNARFSFGVTIEEVL